MKSTLVFILVLAIILLASSASVQRNQQQSRASCGYHSCTKPDATKLNIHLVAHTHDDVGWLKTLDQYYYGGKMYIQRVCVRDIINSVVDALVKDPKRKFIYVETAYLWKWLSLQNDTQRQTMKQLINEGRLEIVGGAWTMNDEASTYYHSIVDQFTWGFRRLNDTFGECARPRVGWQIDPFGHSREQASIFAQLGFDGLFIGRLDYQDKQQRLENLSMEFIWQASPSLGVKADIFSSVLYNLYQAPDGFCFDILCKGTLQINDLPNHRAYNLDKRVGEFLKFVERQSAHYATNNVIITMGGDFNYQDAELYYKNMDKLIRGINELHADKYKAFYSTPSCYLKAVKDKNQQWSRKTDDFLPYASEANAYWTGYFTSRPTLKFFERMGNNMLQVVKQLSVLSNTADSSELQLFREAMGVMQHHDAVTGTEKQHVAEDYARILYHSMRNAEQLASQALNKLTSKNQHQAEVQFNSCLLLNVSSCEYSSEHSTFVVTVYNPSSQPLNTYVRLPVSIQQSSGEYNVIDSDGKAIVSQVVPIPKPVLNLAERRGSKATHELIFRATNIPALSYRSFHLTRDERSDFTTANTTLDNVQEIGNQNLLVSLDERLNGVLVRAPRLALEYKQSFEYYESAIGRSIQVFKGHLLQEIHQRINDWISQVVRVYKHENYVEFDWLIGPIPIGDKLGKEVIVKYASNLKSKDEFYTDSNGREMLKRRLNDRASWKVKFNESISANYYPVTAKISIEDQSANQRLSVLNDRSQGGSSLKSGEIELMLHRRTLKDDGCGVGESLNEFAYGTGLVARGQHIVIIGDLRNRDQLLLQEKQQALKLALRPWIFVTPTAYDFKQWQSQYRMIGPCFVGRLPPNVRILSLEPWKDGWILLRLEHLFEIHESTEYSIPMRVNIKELFAKFEVLSFKETTLGANQYVNQPTAENQSVESDNFIVILKPMEIRTFLLEITGYSQTS